MHRRKTFAATWNKEGSDSFDFKIFYSKGKAKKFLKKKKGQVSIVGMYKKMYKPFTCWDEMGTCALIEWENK